MGDLRHEYTERMEIETIRNSNGQKDRQKRQMKRERETRKKCILSNGKEKAFNVCPLFFIYNVDYIL